MALFCAALAACTPVSKPQWTSAADGGGDASAAALDGGGSKTDSGPSAPSKSAADAGTKTSENVAPPPTGDGCDADGSLRCSKAGVSRQREVCRDGYWAPASDCGEGEVCVAAAGSGDATCLGVAGICRGNAGGVVCDAQGVLYHCGDDGVVQSSQSCPSVRQCQSGLAAMSCAMCASGELRCDGDVLQRCKDDGSGFAMVQRCGAGSCDAAAGLCRGASCTETRSVCRGDVLSTCMAGETDFHDVSTCAPELCDAGRGACNKCVPGLATCAGDVSVQCSADGASDTRVDCSKDGGHCVGAGRCVKCARDADCPDPGACMRASCNLAQGTCEPQPQALGVACAGGVCSANGTCVGCNDAADCPAPGDCQVRSCEAGSCKPKAAGAGSACGNGGKCDASGQCAACVGDGDCPDPGACQAKHCDLASGTCQPASSPKGTKCAAGTCDGAGSCAGCNSDADCPAVATCQQKFCNPSSHVCEPKPAADGGSCSGAFGAGSCASGRCVQCASDAACKSAGACQEGFCRTSDNTCQQRPLASGTSCSGGNVCDGASRCVECVVSASCGANAACLANACQCNPGFVKNPGAVGCNLDDCAKADDNRCGADTSTGNACKNTVDGYDCTCTAPWKLGSDQCYQSGTAAVAKNGSSWDVLPSFHVVCANAFDQNNPCGATGQLTWLNTCGLQGAPTVCSSLAGKQDTLANVSLRRVVYDGALEQYGAPPADNGFSSHVDQLAVGDVILVQSLTALYIMRVTGVDSSALTYDWAMLWRDTCWRPGGATCTAACNCPGGS